MKAISPMIAVILLIAFTVAIGGILSVWLTSVTQTQTSTTGSYAEKVSKCAGVSLSIKNITPITNNQITFRVSHESGAIPLKNVKIVVVYINGSTATLECASQLTPGNICVNTSSNANDIKKARAIGMCLDEISKTAEWELSTS